MCAPQTVLKTGTMQAPVLLSVPLELGKVNRMWLTQQWPPLPGRWLRAVVACIDLGPCRISSVTALAQVASVCGLLLREWALTDVHQERSQSLE